MNRQQVAVAIAKLHHYTLLLRYWQELEPDDYVTALDSQLVHFSEWINGVADYLDREPNEKVYRMLDFVGSTDKLLHYVIRYKDSMPNDVRVSLLDYISVLNRVKEKGKTLHKQSKGNEYMWLVDGLDNERARSLLARAQKIRILDEHFQPYEEITRKQLKVLAFSVSQILNLKSRCKWLYFERQWPSEKNHLSNLPLPSRDRKDMKMITDLYPEVDYTELFAPIKDEYFKTLLTPQQKSELYRLLLENGYITPDISDETFMEIFHPATKEVRIPVKWNQTQGQLCFFVYNMFREGNDKKLWAKTANCFSIAGHKPNTETLKTFLIIIKKKGKIENYDPKLREIVLAVLGK